jgi:cytochrome c biogenesis protein CcmG/thiol:disulfide interchange protein DsbE
MTHQEARRAGRILAVIAAAGLAACESGPPGPRVGKPAPEYVASTLQGDSVALSSLRGKVVLLNLWATWCAPCRHETPFLQSLYEERRSQGLEIVGISMDNGDARDQVEEFVREFGVRYPILVDPQMRGMDSYQVLGLPATFLIDRDGILRWMRFGPVSADDGEFMKALGATLE